jgi:N6-L-threonylcarbamoyladenine synthase
MDVLGIETSCDETAAAVVRDGRETLASIVRSQVALHRPYGGVVPEIASRAHLETLPAVVDAALRESGLRWHEIDAVAATFGPGLASALMVGLSFAKALALRLDRPFIAVNHLEAHLLSVFLDGTAGAEAWDAPFVGLVVSGGHTILVRVDGAGRYRLLGQTIDDAAGEAFDKGANLLGLGYPGGPAIETAARTGRRDAYAFPRGRVGPDSETGGLDPAFCFSFSGLKTALRYTLRDAPLEAEDPRTGSLAASYQEAIVDALMARCERATDAVPRLAVSGGVSLNGRLRERLEAFAARTGRTVYLPERRYCADNAAMIAAVAGLGRGIRGAEALGIDIDPNAPIGTDGCAVC